MEYRVGKTDFNILRLGHIEYFVQDLDRARAFYVDAIGLFETARDENHIYLRGIEDRDHHSVVLTRSPTAGIGHFSFKVASEEDLERLAHKFKGLGCPMRWLEPGEELGQGRALRVQDPLGFQVEYFAEMESVPWLLQSYHLHRHGCPTRLDHLNILIPDAQVGYEWYTRELGFYCSEYTRAAAPSDSVYGSWLFRKPTIHDIAVMTGSGPSVHHAGFSLLEPMGVIRACDALAAAGYADSIERGPARHGISNALFVYLRDPDGNRFELYTGDYLTVDREREPIAWDLDDPRRQSLWGAPPPRRWYEESMTVYTLDGQAVPKVAPTQRAIPAYVD
ncbi:3,4-dihydroxyphenylacetate 2,3-dioxygenase [Castellaniella sp.]|uniref:3,4-dihydroxyphenylacetate 2,3-dioxygenase n=1 Tax=Castellaniella sp. TaxID=1955812 RepID=UPI0035609DA2